jgi:hypothetical protein
MTEGSADTLGRCLVKRSQHVIDVACVELGVPAHDLVGAAPQRFVMLHPRALVRREIAQVHERKLSMGSSAFSQGGRHFSTIQVASPIARRPPCSEYSAEPQ